MDDSFINFALLVSNINPWYIVSVAIAIIVFDVFVVNSEAFLWIGIALIIIAFGNAINLPPIIQLWSYPIALILVFVAQRYIGQLLYRSPDPYRSLETYVGQTGRLRVKISVTDNAQYFQKNTSRNVLNSMTNGEAKSDQKPVTIVRIEFSDGKIFPALLKDGSDLKDGDIAEVFSVQDQQFRVG